MLATMTFSQNFPLRRHGCRGSVVIYVLGIILLASFLITRLMDRAAGELAAESKAAKRADLRQESLSALEASLAVLADESAARSGLHDPAEGWDHPLALFAYLPSEGYTVDVLVEDETGKLSLPMADDEALAAYLTAIGVPATAEDKLVDALLVWTKPDYASLEDSDAGSFAGAALPYEAPQRALRSFAELRAIPAAREVFFDETGEWNDLGRRFQAGASLFSFNASNVNSAPPEVLLARGVDEARVAAIRASRLDRNTHSPFYRSAAELAGAMGRDAAPPGLGTEAQCLHVIVTTFAGARFCRLEAWVRGAGAGAGAAATASPRRQNQEGKAATPTIASVRNNPRKRLDYPFQILELRENDGT